MFSHPHLKFIAFSVENAANQTQQYDENAPQRNRRKKRKHTKGIRNIVRNALKYMIERRKKRQQQTHSAIFAVNKRQQNGFCLLSHRNEFI